MIGEIAIGKIPDEGNHRCCQCWSGLMMTDGSSLSTGVCDWTGEEKASGRREREPAIVGKT
jgi:hypothetical protein